MYRTIELLTKPAVLRLSAGLLCLVFVSACSSHSSSFSNGGLGPLDGGGAGDEAGATSNLVSPPSSGSGEFLAGDATISTAGSCQAGHYTGKFKGTYTSYLTVVGVPLPVAGNVDLTLTESGGAGEFPMYDIENGTISGTADLLFPYRCDMVGTLDCNAKMLVGGGLRNCVYCALGSLRDGGVCLLEGHFAGPLTADYDSMTSSFVNGTWNGSEKAALDDGGLPDGGSITDAGFYIGPGHYGGSGTWSAAYDNGDP